MHARHGWHARPRCRAHARSHEYVGVNECVGGHIASIGGLCVGVCCAWWRDIQGSEEPTEQVGALEPWGVAAAVSLRNPVTITIYTRCGDIPRYIP